MKNNCFTTHQPFFITKAEYYRKCNVQCFGIDYFYQTASGTSSQTAVPDGCADMVFSCSYDNPNGEICGTVSVPSRAMEKKSCIYFGVCFTPEFNYRFSDFFNADELNKGHLSASLILKKETIEKICSETDFEMQRKLFLNDYLPVYESLKTLNSKQNTVACISAKILKHKGIIPINEITAETGYSERYINKLFQAYMGISPKTMEKMIRFQAAIHAMNKSPNISLTDLALGLGYFDQSHFTKDFTSHSGMTPKKYLKHIQENNLNEKILLS